MSPIYRYEGNTCKKQALKFKNIGNDFNKIYVEKKNFRLDLG